MNTLPLLATILFAGGLSSSLSAKGVGFAEREINQSIKTLPVLISQNIQAAVETEEYGFLRTVRVYSQGAPGSGVILKRDKNRYLILTAAHVVRDTLDGEEIMIKTWDGEEHSATISKIYPFDIAELEMKTINNIPYEIAEPMPLQRQEYVFIFGYPLKHPRLDRYKTSHCPKRKNESDFCYKLRVGFIPAYGMAKPVSETSRTGGYGLIYDAETTEGYSGGPVINYDWKVVGIHGQSDVIQTESGNKRSNGVGIPIQLWLKSTKFKFTEINVATRPFPELQQGTIITQDEKEVNELVAKAKELISNLNYNEALIILKQSTHADKHSILEVIGDLFFAQGKYNDALAAYRSARKANNKYDKPNDYTNIGMAYLALKNFELAADILTKSLERYPGDAKTNKLMGDTSMHLSDFANAEYHYLRAMNQGGHFEENDTNEILSETPDFGIYGDKFKDTYLKAAHNLGEIYILLEKKIIGCKLLLKVVKNGGKASSLITDHCRQANHT